MRENPSFVTVTDRDFVGEGFDLDGGVFGREKHMVVETGDDIGQRVSKGDKVDNVAVFV